jgi:integral membrane protein (TIGR01906 family)
MAGRHLRGLWYGFFVVFLVLFVVEWSVFEAGYYEHFFESKNEVNGATLGIHADILDYLQHGRSALPDVAFTLREVAHMEDVRQVFAGIRLLIVLSILGLLILGLLLYISHGHTFSWLPRMLFFGGLAVDILLILFGVSILLDFSGLFAALHNLLFEPGTWLFPQDSLLIQMYPLSFFSGMGVFMAKNLFYSANLFIGVGSLVPYLKKKKWLLP